jgi:hypothetical protein
MFDVQESTRSCREVVRLRRGATEHANLSSVNIRDLASPFHHSQQDLTSTLLPFNQRSPCTRLPSVRCTFAVTEVCCIDELDCKRTGIGYSTALHRDSFPYFFSLRHSQASSQAFAVVLGHFTSSP